MEFYKLIHNNAYVSTHQTMVDLVRASIAISTDPQEFKILQVTETEGNFNESLYQLLPEDERPQE